MKTNFALTTLIIIFMVLPAMAEWTPYTANTSPLETDYISSVNVSPDGLVLIGSNGYGLYTKDSLNWQIFNSDDTGVPINYSLITAYSNDTLFVGSASRNLDTQPLGEGLSIYDPIHSKWQDFNAGLEISPIITGIEIAPAYRAVSTYGGGVTFFTPDGWTRYQREFRTEYTYADSQQQTYKVGPGTYIPTDYIRGIDYDPINDILWIATLSGGAVAYHDGNWTTYNMNNSGLPSNRIQLIQVNPRTGSVYYGTFGFGLAELHDDQWAVYNTGNSPIQSNYIQSMEVRPDNGDLWIGTNYAIHVLTPDQQWSAYIPPDSNLVWGEFYSDIAFDSSGNVWAATFGGGLASMHIITTEPEPEYDSLSVDIKKLKFFLRHHRRHDCVWLNANLQPDVELSEEDTVSATVTSDDGEVYAWQATFDQFNRLFHWGNMEIYFAYVDGSTMFLRYQHNQDKIRLLLFDWRPEINRDNLDNALNVRVQLGNYVGHDMSYIGPADPHRDPDLDTLDYDDEDVLLSSGYYPVVTDIDDDEPITPSSIAIPFNYPNPFNPVTTIAFSIDAPATVRLDIYDILGRQVNSIEDYFDVGVHEIDWDGSDKPSGIYYYTIRYDDNYFKGRMTLLK
jgi:hypothetical protein